MKRSANFEQRDYGRVWTHKGNKFVIGTLHDRPLEITAQYNPKELSRQASATWTAHPNTSARQSPSSDTHLWMEYGTTAPRTLSLELLFDGYEEGISIAKVVEDLESLTMPINMGSSKPSERRPQACVAVWGSQSLRCVVTSVSTNLTMFDATGEPLRAICSVTLQEVDVTAMMKADRNSDDFVSRQEQIASHNNIDKHVRRRHWTDDKPVVDAVSRAQAAQGKSMTLPEQTETPTPVEAEDEQDRDDDWRDEQIPAPMTTPASAPTSNVDAAAPESAPASETESASESASASEPESASASESAPASESASNVDAAPASNTVGTPTSKFAGDDDLDSPRQANVGSPPSNTVGTPSSKFAGDDDLDSPRAPAPDNASDSARTPRTETMPDGKTYHVGNPTDVLTTDPE